MIDKGYFTPEEAAERVPSHVLSRAIGGEETVIVDVEQEAVCAGDLYLFCSDGLSDLVDAAAMARTLIEEADGALAEQAKTLVGLANEAGGRDNITVVLVQVTETGITMAGVTDVGKRRAHNEDHFAIDERDQVVVLADGMGGCKAGEVASHIATGIMLACLKQDTVDNVLGTLTAPEASDVLDVDSIHSLFTAEDGLVEFIRRVPDERNDGLFDELASDRGIEEIEITTDDLFGEATDTVEVDEITALVRGLKVGQWVEFKARTATPIKAHLSWIGPAGQVYLFTDRRGRKVADPNQQGLIVEMRTGDARVLDDVSFVDRVWGHMTAKLRERTVADYGEPLATG